ncbi:MAG TPA: type II toxin-antitoxin system mRNA interferase toxin, RelE/StbE family [Patescibacteria group bacterium]|nr:type II toxin-antitoxin system mRNA interferase toxin, RelE/StbE family [Patescibacteria group bacterium]
MNKKVSRIDFANKFLKQQSKAPFEIKRAWIKRLALFNQNPFHSQLKNHALTGQFKGRRSINITGDWRAIYMEHKGRTGTVIVFELLGTHSQLYK